MTQAMLTGAQKSQDEMRMPVEKNNNKAINFGDKAVYTQSQIL